MENKEGNNIENKKFLTNVLKNRDIKTATYSVIRLYYDGLNPAAVGTRIKNESNVAGYEIVQLYIEALSFSVARPVLELKGFKKLWFEWWW